MLTRPMPTDMSWHKKGANRHDGPTPRRGHYGRPEAHADRDGRKISKALWQKISEMKADCRRTDKIG